jgi:hypothetical protein
MINSQALGLKRVPNIPDSNGHSDFFMLRKPSLSLLERCIQIVAGKWQERFMVHVFKQAILGNSL